MKIVIFPALPEHTFCVAGTRYVGTFTWRLALWNSLAADMKSSVLPPAAVSMQQQQQRGSSSY